MMYMSTRHATPSVNFQEALFQGLAPDGGLYVPENLSPLPSEALADFKNDSLLDLGEKIIHHFLPETPADNLQQVIHQTLTFPIPLVPLEKDLFLLEVFHGPTLAFKDVGARFMASMLSYFLAKHDQRVTILVATSGDTGSAIAHGFYNIPHVDVYILYPSKKITFLQEKQMTTLGGNIHALEVTGTFDDCQKLVKTALSDEALKNELALTTANSINIARLLPQIIYHSWGLAQFKQHGFQETPVLSVPSGNFGNLTAAIYAKQIGFPLQHFIAATNVNAIVPHYLKTGEFMPQPSQQSCSNAMDVGNPSNFERLQELYSHDYRKMGQEVTGISISDESTLHEIRQTYEKTGYILDPHTAVGVAAARQFRLNDAPKIVTATAHPAKFPEVIKRAIQIDVKLPENLAKALNQPKQSTLIAPDYPRFKELLLALN